MTTENKNTNTNLDNSNQKKSKNRYWEVIIAVSIVAAIGLAAIYMFQQKSKESLAIIESEKQDLNKQINQRDSLINDWFEVFGQIEHELAQIKEKENLLSIKSAEIELTEDKKHSIISDIQYLNTMLHKNKQKIADLNKKLRGSGLSINSLEQRIAKLDSTVEARDKGIADLKVMLVQKDFEMVELNGKIDEMETEIGQQQAVINIQENELNKGFLAQGTYKELKEKGLITKEGGFLGIVGKNKSLDESFSDDHFKEINIMETNKIPLYVKEAHLITEHPRESYEMVTDEENEQIAYIEIKDRASFWKISRYAVVETK